MRRVLLPRAQWRMKCRFNLPPALELHHHETVASTPSPQLKRYSNCMRRTKLLLFRLPFPPTPPGLVMIFLHADNRSSLGRVTFTLERLRAWRKDGVSYLHLVSRVHFTLELSTWELQNYIGVENFRSWRLSLSTSPGLLHGNYRWQVQAYCQFIPIKCYSFKSGSPTPISKVIFFGDSSAISAFLKIIAVEKLPSWILCDLL